MVSVDLYLLSYTFNTVENLSPLVFLRKLNRTPTLSLLSRHLNSE